MENVKVLIEGITKDVYGIFYIYNSKYYFIYTEKELDENNYVVLYVTQVGKETKNTENGPVDTGYMVGVEVTNPEEQQKVQTSISYIVEDKKNNTINPQIQYLPMSMLTNLKIVSKKRFKLLKTIIVDNFKLPIDNVVTQVATTAIEPIIDPVSQPVNEVTNVVAPVSPQPVVSEAQVIPAVQTIPQPQVSMEPVVQPIAPTIPVVPVVGQQLQPLADINNNVVNEQSLPVTQSNPVTVNTQNDMNVIVDYRSKYFEEEEKNKELQAQIDELTQKLNDIKKVLE